MSSRIDITIGQYYHRNSPVHRLDPRTKLLCLLLLIISTFLVKKVYGFLIIAAFTYIAIILAHLPLRIVLRSLRRLLWLFISILVLNILFVDGTGTPILSLGPLKASWQGVYNGFTTGCRFVLIIAGTVILTSTTAPIRLADGIAEVLRPLKRAGLPVYQIPLMIVIVLHFVPMLFIEAKKFILLQEARGTAPTDGNVFRKIRIFMPVLPGLLRSSLRMADELAVGMESRCYHSHARSHLYELRFSRSDAVALVITAAMIILTLL